MDIEVFHVNNIIIFYTSGMGYEGIFFPATCNFFRSPELNSRNLEPQTATAVQQEMPRHRLQPDLITFNTARGPNGKVAGKCRSVGLTI